MKPQAFEVYKIFEQITCEAQAIKSKVNYLSTKQELAATENRLMRILTNFEINIIKFMYCTAVLLFIAVVISAVMVVSFMLE